MELPTLENTLLEFAPINRIVPITMTRTTASITAYSATSCPSSLSHSLRTMPVIGFIDLDAQNFCVTGTSVHCFAPGNNGTFWEGSLTPVTLPRLRQGL